MKKESDSFDIIFIFLKTHNAALRGEQRQPPNLSHCAVTLKLIQTKTAKRCESLLNALLVAKPKALI
ncbi:hypothetical protein BBN03_01590 [Vibrio parahaemolyticus]|uniref:hypothetical protein n=1 Tax=Vibrio parahaemolyticus TaxID=670 RepID=UPI00084B398B|nr:hypothetical protein [Vibrio parahaemolyticus]EJI6691006.1 hypothetical protein [Vibrio parahaemolyticus]OEA93481.1 hypothetical protein BBN03_01590 [Vibrio parahaemolyticus]